MSSNTKKSDFRNFKELLIGEKRKLLNDALSLEDDKITITREELSDESDIATFEENQHLNLRLKTRERTLIKKIDKALKRIDDGSYFECDSCGAEISRKRLRARPVTTMCIECKEAQEIEEKQSAQ